MIYQLNRSQQLHKGTQLANMRQDTAALQGNTAACVRRCNKNTLQLIHIWKIIKEVFFLVSSLTVVYGC